MRDVSTWLDMTKMPEAHISEDIRHATRAFIERTKVAARCLNPS
jgi:hypothetical protein